MTKERGRPVRTFSTVWTKLRENGAAYRKAFVGSQVKRLIPFQIYALRKMRGWSQEELADRSGLTQGVISRAEDPDYGNMTFNTVISIAGGFDVAFIGKFVPFRELDDYLVGLSEKSAGSIPSFAEDNQRVVQLVAERQAGLESLIVPQQFNPAATEGEANERQKVFSFPKVFAGIGQPLLQSPVQALRGEPAQCSSQR